MSEQEWPRHPDGRPMKMGEMTAEQRRQCWRGSMARVKAEFAAKQPASGGSKRRVG